MKTKTLGWVQVKNLRATRGVDVLIDLVIHVKAEGLESVWALAFQEAVWLAIAVTCTETCTETCKGVRDMIRMEVEVAAADKEEDFLAVARDGMDPITDRG